MDRIGKEPEDYRVSNALRDEESAESWVQLGDEIETVLVPARPGADFRRCLRDDLLAVLQQRPLLSLDSGSQTRRRAFILGATVGSLLPLFGVMGYLLCSRLVRKPQRAVSH